MICTPDGAVFTTEGDAAPMVWIMTDFDPGQRCARYVIVRPGLLATQLSWMPKP